MPDKSTPNDKRTGRKPFEPEIAVSWSTNEPGPDADGWRDLWRRLLAAPTPKKKGGEQ
jgi:hypothetical protein